MKILVADDTEVMLLLVSRFVESLGHQVIKARDGLEAIDLYKREMPDAVLMDMVMPNMDGLDAARAIKQLAGNRWIPIIFVSAIGEEVRLADALERGGDDYLVKPVNFRVLEAKLKAVQRSVDLNRTVLEQSAKLADYYDRAEDEKKVARHLMEQLVNAERLSDPQVQYWLNPAESLSGDLIAVARTPGRVLHVLLADGIGHGLTAALNVLPLTQPFYAMTEKGFSLSAILSEMNAKVRQVLPFGRFVSVAMLALDPVNNRIEVWNGGIPPILLFGEDGREKQRFVSHHVPLGIVSDHEFDDRPVSIRLTQGDRLVLYSDGLVEAYNARRVVFGQENLANLIGPGSGVDVLKRLTEGFLSFMDGAQNHDDISVVIVDVADRNTIEMTQEARALLAVLDPHLVDGEGLTPEWSMNMMFGPLELRSMNVVPLLMGVINQIPVLTDSHTEVFLILSELFNNALDHGLLSMDSRLKQVGEGMEAYLEERTRRLGLLESGQIAIHLDGMTRGDWFLLRIVVEDSGPGFDIQAVEQSLASNRNCHGRGISLVRSLCLRVDYLGRGNRVVAYFVPNRCLISPVCML